MRLLAAPVILIVDDDTGTRQMLTEIFSLEGFQSKQAVDGREAMALMRVSGPYIVLLDVVMPHMDAKDVMAALKSLPQLRQWHWIILMTSRNGLREYAKQLGADAYLRKPFTVEDLLTTVNDALRRWRVQPGYDVRN